MSNTTFSFRCKASLYKLVNYEYWPTHWLYLLVFPYLFYLGLKAKSLVFFTNVNPLLDDGGMVEYSKQKINESIPSKYRPKSLFLKQGQPNLLLDFYPVVAKPDFGERGKGVTIISTQDQLNEYISTSSTDLIIEELITLPNEAGIFYMLHPIKGPMITSITLKEFLTVTGNSVNTIGELMHKTWRARLQIYRMPSEVLSKIPKINEEIVLEPIGNHNRGTKFINGNHLIDKAILDVFESVASQIPNFNYGRFDIKYNTWEELKKGKNFMIIELNGVNSEPTHIYDQVNTGLISAIKDLNLHWKYMYEISIANKNNGIIPMKTRLFLHRLK